MVNRENTVAQPKRTYTGPLGAYIDGFVALLLREGYKPRSVKKKFELVMDLSRWMGRRKLPLARLRLRPTSRVECPVHSRRLGLAHRRTAYDG
jgi:hypothetical protein